MTVVDPNVAVSLLTACSFVFQLLGIIFFGRKKRNAAWAMILVGCLMANLTPILTHLLRTTILHLDIDQNLQVMIFLVPRAFGIVLFSMGLFFYALMLYREKDRLAELEAIATSQAVELEQLRNGGAGSN